MRRVDVEDNHLAGIVAGLALAVAAIRSLVDLVPAGLDPLDSAMFIEVAALVMLTGLAATFAPARRAAVDPAVALRQD